MRTERERCSARSEALGESMIGTASEVANWLLLEHPGPWGADVLRGSRLGDGIGPRLRRMRGALGIRVVLIRRYGGSTERAVSCFLAHTGPDRPWLERLRLRDPGEVVDLDLSSLAQGEAPGLGEPDPGPLFLACTHGRRDPCCAERGRPLARALDRAYGDRAWEVSHIGGDRFAGNLVCLPHGLYLGRLDPAGGLGAAWEYADGRIDLQHYRGRSCYRFAVQAAEIFLRNRLGLAGVDDLRLVRIRRVESDVVEATFDCGQHAGPVMASVRTRPAGTERTLTCHAAEPVRPPVHSLVKMEL